VLTVSVSRMDTIISARAVYALLSCLHPSCTLTDAGRSVPEFVALLHAVHGVVCMLCWRMVTLKPAECAPTQNRAFEVRFNAVFVACL
jgi:hypothetical protein